MSVVMLKNPSGTFFLLNPEEIPGEHPALRAKRYTYVTPVTGQFIHSTHPGLFYREHASLIEEIPQRSEGETEITEPEKGTGYVGRHTQSRSEPARGKRGVLHTPPDATTSLLPKTLRDVADTARSSRQRAHKLGINPYDE